jgi:hypothetical protein
MWVIAVVVKVVKDRTFDLRCSRRMVLVTRVRAVELSCLTMQLLRYVGRDRWRTLRGRPIRLRLCICIRLEMSGLRSVLLVVAAKPSVRARAIDPRAF